MVDVNFFPNFHPHSHSTVIDTAKETCPNDNTTHTRYYRYEDQDIKTQHGIEAMRNYYHIAKTCWKSYPHAHRSKD